MSMPDTTSPGQARVQQRRGVLRPLSVAPMMDRTDRHFRRIMRLITRKTLLYTEMVTTGAILHGDRDRLLAFEAMEGPLALQLGGDDPGDLTACARIAEERGFDEVNINVGCPSERVQKGAFGVSLMFRPERVAAAVEAMRAAVSIPVTVKHRIGVDDLDAYEDMLNFVDVVAAAGCDRFSVHARKAWLQGLSPKENRNIPPLRYEDVYRLKAERPELHIEINGGFTDLETSIAQLPRVDAVMIGRMAYEDPYAFAEADRLFFGDDTPCLSRREVVEAMLPSMEERLAQGLTLHGITRHLLTLYKGQPGARAWRRALSADIHQPGAGLHTVERALEDVTSLGHE